jgi:hypothetical protein
MKTHSGHSPSSDSGLGRSGLSRRSVPEVQRRPRAMRRDDFRKLVADSCMMLPTDAARRAGTRLARAATNMAIAYGNRGADDVGQRLHVAERDAPMFHR